MLSASSGKMMVSKRVGDLAYTPTDCLFRYVTLRSFSRYSYLLFLFKYGLDGLRQIRIVDEDKATCVRPTSLFNRTMHTNNDSLNI
jgi:hypothetical protein